MSKKISINIGRIVIGIPRRDQFPGPRPSEVLQRILHGLETQGNDEEEEDKNELSSIDDLKDAVSRHVDAMEAEIRRMGDEKEPEKVFADVDGHGEVDLIKAKEILSARTVDLKVVLEHINKAIANEEARQAASKSSN